MIAPLDLPRRYLVGFDPRDLAHHFTDVLVIGGGVAGLRAALGIPDSQRVLVVTKDEVRESNSTYAQGGIAGVLAPDDHFDDHIADTLAAGKGLCDPEVVDLIVREAPERIAELIAWGTEFDRVDGQVALTREGGHSHPRIVHALGDATGREVMRAIIGRARTRPNLRIWQNSFTIDLLDARRINVAARSSGISQAAGPSLVWARATDPGNRRRGPALSAKPPTRPIATGDGHAVGLPRGGRCSATWSSCSSTPPSCTSPGSSRHLLTEALRGEGAYLRDRIGRPIHAGRFIPQAELAPRDDVSRAITAHHGARPMHPCVYLDL